MSRKTLQKKISEKEFQAQVIELACLCGWNYYHTYDSRRSQCGWPDLVLLNVELGATVFAELKTESGRLSKAQKAMAAILSACGHDVRLWRPSDWDEIEATLKGER